MLPAREIPPTLRGFFFTFFFCVGARWWRCSTLMGARAGSSLSFSSLPLLLLPAPHGATLTLLTSQHSLYSRSSLSAAERRDCVHTQKKEAAKKKKLQKKEAAHSSRLCPHTKKKKLHTSSPIAMARMPAPQLCWGGGLIAVAKKKKILHTCMPIPVVC
jgi:hypothetical protein